jgi:Xaa-Pro aminopeptidase
MRDDIAARTRDAMDRAGLDAVVAISPENFAYLTGFVVPSQADLRWRHAAAVLGADGGEGILCVDMEETTVRDRAGETEIRVWGEFTDNPMAVLADLLGDLGLDTARIGVEFDYLPAGDLRDLEGRLPLASFVSAEAMMNGLRQIKTADELDLLRRLSRISDTAIEIGRASCRERVWLKV